MPHVCTSRLLEDVPSDEMGEFVWHLTRLSPPQAEERYV